MTLLFFRGRVVRLESGKGGRVVRWQNGKGERVMRWKGGKGKVRQFKLHPSSAICPHTPAPPLPHTKSLLSHKSQLSSPAHYPMISVTVYTSPFRSSKTE